MNTEHRIREAIESGEVLRVRYYGGSQPGSVRSIAPMSIDTDTVSARCLASNTVKTFVLAKLEMFEGDDVSTATDAPREYGTPEHYSSLTQLLEVQRSALSELGWHIEVEPDHVSLHRTRKSGQPLKTSDVSIDYSEMTYDLISDTDGVVHTENIRKRLRPWTVRGKGQTSKTYAELDKAAALFMEWARALAPPPK